jgi:hypothetical protein
MAVSSGNGQNPQSQSFGLVVGGRGEQGEAGAPGHQVLGQDGDHAHPDPARQPPTLAADSSTGPAGRLACRQSGSRASTVRAVSPVCTVPPACSVLPGSPPRLFVGAAGALPNMASHGMCSGWSLPITS